jgi:hypothetical protein
MEMQLVIVRKRLLEPSGGRMEGMAGILVGAGLFAEARPKLPKLDRSVLSPIQSMATPGKAVTVLGSISIGPPIVGRTYSRQPPFIGIIGREPAQATSGLPASG